MITDEPLAETASALRSGEIAPSSYVGKLRDRFETVEPEINAFVDGEVRSRRLSAA